ncbi:MAG: zf-HC2 domain-containing protein [Ardenticatenales bacterium]|nr:zf-HC2 domain-containing protein [Ardenticatenales bacterium]
MNNCDEILELISLQLDEALEAADANRLTLHLTHCPDCALAFSELQAVDALFHRAPMKYAPSGFTTRVVDAAFADALRYNLRLGVVGLMVGTLVISVILIMGQASLVWTVLSILFAPGFLSSGSLWMGEFWQALMIGGRVSLSVLDILRGLLLGPLLVPSVLSLLCGAFVTVLIQRKDQQTLTMT